MTPPAKDFAVLLADHASTPSHGSKFIAGDCHSSGLIFKVNVTQALFGKLAAV